ncbi:ACP S-malonyltransferase [Actinokineospora sp. PR83]|nr:ACP S-malonyltransferase [Actinokineospora sp. PR83]
MGKALFDRFPDEVGQVGEILGYSLEKLCLENPNRLLDETQYAQPAIFVVNALHHLERRRNGEPAPAYAIGHSLGEYNALFAAEVFDFATGVRLVKKRGELMGRIGGGGMAAVVGLTRAEVAEALDAHGLTEQVDIANDNAPTQVVISGPRQAVVAAKPLFEALPGGITCTVLRTSGAFHSRYMADARHRFEAYLAEHDFPFAPPKIPVLANATAEAYDHSSVARNLVDQITAPVRWAETVRRLLDHGETEFTEVGTGRVLTSLLDRIRPAVAAG